jgi:PAS domain S-box-containing protein
MFGLYGSSRYSYLLFHNFVELAGALVVFLIFFLAWNTRHVLDNRYLLFIGIASLCPGVLVLAHTLAYEGMKVFPGYDADLAMQLWVAFRYVYSISFLLAPLFLNRNLHAGMILTAYGAATAVLVSAIFLGQFPVCYIEGVGFTRFKIISEYAVSLILLASLGLLYRIRDAFDRGVFLMLSGSILSSLFSALSYTQYARVIDVANIAGHFFELLSSYLLFKAVVVTGVVDPASLLFRNLKLSEERIRESEERYRSLVELSPDAIGVHCEGQYVYINPAGLALYGAVEAAELTGKNVLDLVHPEHRDAVAERIRTTYEEKERTPFRDAKILRLDGREVDVEAASTPISYLGKPAAQVVIRDITVRKRTEEALWRANEELETRVRERTRELRTTVDALQQEIRERARAEEESARLALAVQSTAEGVVVTDSRGMIQYVNPAFEKITGYGRSEIIGRDLHMFDGGKQDTAFYRKLRETLARDGVWSGRLANTKKDGTVYYEECTLSPIRSQAGEIINYVSVRRDVTDKLRLESIAEAAVTMNNIGYVFTGISHEIGNPLNTLMVTLDLLKDTLNAGSKEAIAEHVDRALSQVSKIDYLMASLRNFGMSETQDLQNMRVASFIDQFLSLVSEDFRKKGITIEAALAPDAERAYADPRALQQVMLNIFTNAADALADRTDPRIIVRVSRDRGDRVRISVEDNGCGMTAEQRENLFKPFYTSKPRGTGLGMVIIKNMLTKMNGTIEVASRKDEGTRLVITIPEGGRGQR